MADRKAAGASEKNGQPAAAAAGPRGVGGGDDSAGAGPGSADANDIKMEDMKSESKGKDDPHHKSPRKRRKVNHGTFTQSRISSLENCTPPFPFPCPALFLSICPLLGVPGVRKAGTNPCLQGGGVYVAFFLLLERIHWLMRIPFFCGVVQPVCTAEDL